jgi:calcineurin-like phosphoesterase family protein
MPATFLVSDPHFGHSGTCRFLRDDGITKLRPWTDVDEMDEAMVAAWNERVNPLDKVYVLGDVVISSKKFPILDRLNGDKILIKGNHDIFKLEDYSKYFRDIRAYHVLNGMILSHIPLHPESLHRFGTNIHGHLHDKRVRLPDGEIDVRYQNVCVEQTPDFAPILFDDVIKRILYEGGQVGFREGTYGNGSTK